MDQPNQPAPPPEVTYRRRASDAIAEMPAAGDATTASQAAELATLVPSVDEMLLAHLKAGNAEMPTLQEHFDRLNLPQRDGFDQDGRLTKKPHGSLATLLARFRSHGLTLESRLSKEAFEAAMDEAQNARV